ncbi:MAG: MFS transporter, partial [Geminicoccaceae bacterium]
MAKVGLGQRLVSAVTMALVAGTSFFLLFYVGYGEANRSYEQFYVEKLTAQAKVMVNSVEGFLKRDLPLHQYVGFQPRAERLLSSDQTVVAISGFDRRQHVVFSSGNEQVGLLRGDQIQVTRDESNGVEVRRDDIYLQVVLPLNNGHQTVGGIAITMPHAVISAQVEAKFAPLLPVAAGLALAFAVFVGMCSNWLGRQRRPILQIVYASLFLIVAALVISILVSLYTKGTQIKTKALADSLGQRMTEVVGFKLDIAQIPGLDQAFSEYRRLNPDIASAALVVDDTILIHTDSYMVGKPWESTSGHYEYIVDISPAGSDRQVNIAVILPQEIVYWRTLRSIKNFAALFIASAFLASLFLQIAGSFHQRAGPCVRGSPKKSAPDDERTLKLVKPVFYVTMCVEHLSYAFLASYIADTVDASGLAAGMTSTVFTIYYLCFALTLIPAGHLAQQFSPKPLMVLGLFLTAVSFLMLLDGGNVGFLIVARAGAGIGQAMLFIGVQSYILSVSSPTKKTQGAAIIVYGFQGGMISGMAIGSLLVTYIGAAGVFAIGAVATMLTMIYAIFVVPATDPAITSSPVGFGASAANLGRHVIKAVRNPSLLQAIGLVGIPAKAVLTGVVVFALPLLMAQQDYRQEDIGQLLMLYAGGVVVANGLISRWVDRTGDTRFVLMVGGLLSGVGLCIISYLGWSWFADIAYGNVLETVVLVVGILLLGVAHGLINAPIVSHVATLKLGEQIGVSALTATYRFLERVGHIAGPLIVGQIFIFGGEQASVIAWIGISVAVLGLLFFWFDRGRRPSDRVQTPTAKSPLGYVDDILALHLDHPHQTLVLAMRPSDSVGVSDPAQETMIRHLGDYGAEIDSAALATLTDTSADDWPSDVSTIVAERRSALRLRAFLSEVSAETGPDQQLLVIVGSNQMRYRGQEIVNWLGRNRGSKLVVMTSAHAWLDQMRGWLTLMSLDSSLSVERKGCDLLIAALKEHFRESKPAQM